MSQPDLESDGYLPPGIHAASFHQVEECFGVGSEARERQAELLRLLIEAARSYPTIKRVLLWGSFVTDKPEPNDLDYSIVVSVGHPLTQVAPEHRRFFVPSDARRFYGADANYLVIYDYPLERYIERMDFLCHRRDKQPCGIVEIHLHGEFTGETP